MTPPTVHTTPLTALTHDSRVSPMPRTSATSSISCVSEQWAESMEIPWKKFTIKMQNAIKSKKNVDVPDKHAMVRVVVDEMLLFDNNPRLEHATTIARRIVCAYPDSFQDRNDEGERLGNGYHSLTKKIKNRIDHVNRNNGSVRLRTARRRLLGSGDDATEPAVRRKPVDKYGCVTWQPTG